jgi:dethiobiotin synthetase
MGKNELSPIVISGVGTDVGKTVVSAIFCKALGFNYWKPIQAGDLDHSDSMKVGAFCPEIHVFEEQFRLKSPMSPHAAARKDGVSIELSDFSIPPHSGNLIIEGAGGLMVPINDQGDLYIDLFEQWNFPLVLVSRNYLGSINHTLLSIEALQKRNVNILGLVFVGEANLETESIVCYKTKLPVLARIPLATELNQAFIEEQAHILRNNLKNEL